MFGSWKEFKLLNNQGDNASDACISCGEEDFDLLCKEKGDDETLLAIFICKNCGMQKKMEYGELEVN
ncbi:hypothetical protein [Planomicrobium sp. MB-3u-38]|uniref:hypothetical protein n=1 Tax=Planomicrobium sp. MB-3u-38 TaxID=2058318 RepID=UPI000C7DAD97|nr:hypothetical protein [Planomicrobium sp. MB-3u-38]PKH09938.1 hypothetical protein CXF70_12060 [Planomicrobium sp. MB-3u-38]